MLEQDNLLPVEWLFHQVFFTCLLNAHITLYMHPYNNSSSQDKQVRYTTSFYDLINILAIIVSEVWHYKIPKKHKEARNMDMRFISYNHTKYLVSLQKPPIEFHVKRKYIIEVVTFYLLWPINFHLSYWDKENISLEKQNFVSAHVMLTICSVLFLRR